MVPVLMYAPNVLKAVSNVTKISAMTVIKVIIINRRQINVYHVKVPI
jgi:hypothetical protein